MAIYADDLGCGFKAKVSRDFKYWLPVETTGNFWCNFTVICHHDFMPSKHLQHISNFSGKLFGRAEEGNTERT